MERVEDKSKALSYIGIEVADALKLIPVPVATANNAKPQENKVESATVVINTADTKPQQTQAYENYYADTRQEVRESLWTKFKNSKVVRAFKYAFRIRITLSLPEGLPSGENNNK